MTLEEFLVCYPLRIPNVMWFLGAGASASAGVKTAYDMIWDFKRSLYCARNRVPLEAMADLGDPAVRSRLQSFFDGLRTFPSGDATEEYTAYFEAALPDEADRQRYITQQIESGAPSFGHKALAIQMRADKVRIAWTTNFDPLIEDAAVGVFGSIGKITVASLGEPELAMQAINASRWPVVCKVHGDFRSRRLKNTTEELRSQDQKMRRALVESCKRFGLAVVGYSGRDGSVMEALEEAIDGGSGYPYGLFWFTRRDSEPLDSVTRVVNDARAAGVDAQIIYVDTFDELMGDVTNLLNGISRELRDTLDARAGRVSDAPIPSSTGGSPIIRLNAVPITAPSSCRLVDCKIGGTKVVREAIESSGANLVAMRRQVGVIAFGSDGAVRQAFGAYKIKAMSLHSIESDRLKFESAEMGLLYDALSHALQRERPVLTQKRRNTYIAAVDPERATESCFDRLRKTLTLITGTVPKTKLRWSEAVRLRLEYRFGHLWLLLTPAIWFTEPVDKPDRNIAQDFVRERLARRYNSTWNTAFAGWLDVLIGDDDQAAISAFGIGDGIDASFIIHRRSAISKRETGT